MRACNGNSHHLTSCQAPSLYPTARYADGANPTASCKPTLPGLGNVMPA